MAHWNSSAIQLVLPCSYIWSWNFTLLLLIMLLTKDLQKDFLIHKFLRKFAKRCLYSSIQINTIFQMTSSYSLFADYLKTVTSVHLTGCLSVCLQLTCTCIETSIICYTVRWFWWKINTAVVLLVKFPFWKINTAVVLLVKFPFW